MSQNALNRFPSSLSAALCLTFAAAVALTPVVRAQTELPKTAFQKQLDRVDLGLSGAGIFNGTVSGPVTRTDASNAGQTIVDSASNTLGGLLNIRYIAKPLIGVEFNYTYSRNVQNYSNVGGVQARVNEYSLGYIVTPAHTVFGFQPFVSAGSGTIAFKPTPRGGQSLNEQARQVYYFSAGLQQDYLSHLGFRASYRQVFYLAPDFGQNYLTILKHTSTAEPTVGVYVRF